MIAALRWALKAKRRQSGSGHSTFQRDLLLTKRAKETASLHVVQGEAASRRTTRRLDVLAPMSLRSRPAAIRVAYPQARTHDPQLFDGIGNAYRTRSARSEAVAFQLSTNSRMKKWIATRRHAAHAARMDRSVARRGRRFPEKVRISQRDAVHGKYKQPCPSALARAAHPLCANEANYCATCQTARVLADRSLSGCSSRLARSLEEWEASWAMTIRRALSADAETVGRIHVESWNVATGVSCGRRHRANRPRYRTQFWRSGSRS